MLRMNWIKPGVFAILLTSFACSSSSDDESSSDASLTTQELLETCVASELDGLSSLFETLLGVAAGGEGVPQPEFNLLAALLNGGRVPWTLDADGDGENDIGGEIFFRDAEGNLTIPFDIGQLLEGGLPDDLTQLLNNVPDGTTLHILWDAADLLAANDSEATGSGSFVIEFADGVIGAASGDSRIRSGECAFDFNFDDIGLDDFDGGNFPETEAGFDLRLGGNQMLGTVLFDGAGFADFIGSLDGGPQERIRFDLATGTRVD